MIILFLIILILITLFLLIIFFNKSNFVNNYILNKDKLKISFVTGYIGSDLNTHIPKINEKIDSYFITNNDKLAKNLKQKNIFTDIILIDIPIIDSSKSIKNYVTNSFYSKMLKVFPQYFLTKKYDFVIWFDNKFNVNTKDTLHVINNWNNNHSLMLHKHPFLNNVKEELKESLKQPRYVYEKKKYEEYINNLKKCGFSDNYNKHSQTGFIIYNLNHDYTKKIQYEWFKHIKKCGIQCQISFNLLRQIYEDYIGEFKYNIKK